MEDLKKLAEDLNKAIEAKASTETIDKLKSDMDTASKAAADKLKAAEEKAAAAETEAKAATVKFDEMDKKFNTYVSEQELKSKSAPKAEKGLSFNEAIEKAFDKNHDDIEKFVRKEKGFNHIVMDLDTKAVGDISTGNVTGTRYGSQFAPQIIEPPKRKVHIRSLLPVAQAGPGNTYTFMRDNGSEGDPAPVSEGALKPQFDADLIESTVNFETIAGWSRVTRKAMMNIPGFMAWVQSRFPERLMRVEDAQILYGNGTTPNLKGILTSGNFVNQPQSAGTVLAEKIINAIALLEDTYEREATGVLIRPVDYYGFFKNKATGSGEYDLPQNFTFNNGVLYISGVPVYASTALNNTDFVVGDWQQGAQLLVQEGMKLEFFEQDGTNVRENKVTIRIEETVALPVFGPDYFIKGVSTYSAT